MRTGTEIGQPLIGKAGAEREALIWAAIVKKEFPSYTGAWEEIRIRDVDAKGVPHDLILRVAPRYFELGTDSDPIFMPMWPETAQRLANTFNATLPSEKIVDLIWNNTEVRLPIGPPPGFKIPGPAMEETPSWIAHSQIVGKMLSNYRFGVMSGGYKDVVVGPGLDGSRVAIYSTPFSGTGDLRPYAPELVDDPWNPGKKFHPPRHQPYSTIHAAKYSDYSHGIRLISRNANLDGREVDLASIFLDPVLSVLVSDQGNFYPSFPNIGTARKMAATYGVTQDFSEPGPAPSGPIADPMTAVGAPSPLVSIIGATPNERNRVYVGSGIGVLVGLLGGFSVKWTAIATLTGAGIAKIMSRGG
jgi:hypothetical protein